MARKRARGEAPWIFRILLLPMLYGYLRLLSFLDYPSLDFVFQLPNAPFLTYGRNYLLLAAYLLGFLLILFAAPGRRLPLGAGLLLLTCPVWMRAFLQFHAVQGGARAVGEVVLSRPLAIASAALPALWGLMMVRGPRRREWEKSLIAVALLARVGYVTFLGRASAEACIDDMLLTGVAILIGAAVDCVYTAPTAADLCVPALALGWLFAAQVWRVLTLQYALLATIALSLVALILTLAAKPARRHAYGYAWALAAVTTTAAAILYLHGPAL